MRHVVHREGDEVGRQAEIEVGLRLFGDVQRLDELARRQLRETLDETALVLVGNFARHRLGLALGALPLGVEQLLQSGRRRRAFLVFAAQSRAQDGAHARLKLLLAKARVRAQQLLHPQQI